MQIRPMEKRDRQGIVDILNQVIRTGGQIAFTEETSLEERSMWFDSHQSSAHPILVAEDAGKIVGWISLSAYRPGRSALSATVEVSYGVEASMRHKGVGTQMLQEILSIAKEQQHRVVFAIIFDNNVATRGLLEKFGFKQWGHMPEVAELNGSLVGHHYYGLLLKE